MYHVVLFPSFIMRMAANKAQLGTNQRKGCFGCLWQATWQLAILLLLGSIFVLAITGIFAPWAFYLGGNFHILPYWQGWGLLHAKSGEYGVFVRIEPTSRGSPMYLETNLTGIAYVCTPRGQNFRMNLGGGMRKHLNRSTDGEAIHLYMDYWPWDAQFINDHSPSLEFRGNWRNPNLVMDDHSSIARAFQDDGTVDRGHHGNRAYLTEIVPVTFVPGSYSDFERACSTVHR